MEERQESHITAEGPASRLSAARALAGQSEMEAAAAVGLSLAWYYDLEADNEELLSNLTLLQISTLARFLRIDPVWLLTGENTCDERAHELSLLVDLVRARTSETQNGLAELEDNVGYELAPFLADWRAAYDWNSDLLRAVCTALEVDWRAYMPHG